MTSSQLAIARISGGSRTSSRADSRSKQRSSDKVRREDREARVLNRIIRVTPEGWEYEPDQRHADILIQAMNLSGAKGVKAPGEDEKNWEMSDNDQAVDPKEETHFRALAARANYLALDGMDLQYATKEVCRGMAAPTRGHVKKLRRLIRYLIEVPRVVTEYKFQGDVREIGQAADGQRDPPAVES